jgi:hypothetical protein
VDLGGDTGRCSALPPDRLSDEKLIEITHYWQDKLRLLHWDAEISYVQIYEMEGEYREGEAAYDRANRMAKIRLIDPAAADPSLWPWRPAEETIIHELLHLLFSPVWDGEDKKFVLETEAIINVLAHSLYEQRQEAEKPRDWPGEICKLCSAPLSIRIFPSEVNGG